MCPREGIVCDFSSPTPTAVELLPKLGIPHSDHTYATLVAPPPPCWWPETGPADQPLRSPRTNQPFTNPPAALTVV